MAEPSRGSVSLTRRRYLELTALGGAAVSLTGASKAAAQTAVAPASTKKRALRFAHLTDLHIQPERAAAAGTAACFKHVQAQTDRPELIITGGDTVMDVFEVDQARTDLLGKLWGDTVKAECSLPVRSCIGNHDVRPWTDADATGGAAAKAWATDLLHLDRRYYGFDQGGWRFLVLDTVQPNNRTYAGFIDEEQRDWLEGELKTLAGARPVVVVSHIPILSLTTLTFQADPYSRGEVRVSDTMTLRDGTAIHYLLRQHENVKLCLSGHTHLCDRCELDGVTYICGGAVCGRWWQGLHQEVAEGYGLVDLYDDGSFNYAYTPYGWQAQA